MMISLIYIFPSGQGDGIIDDYDFIPEIVPGLSDQDLFDFFGYISPNSIDYFIY